MRRQCVALAIVSGIAFIVAGAVAPAALTGNGVVGSGDAVTASADCSKLEANAAVKRLGLSDASVVNPVFRVLCGAFSGQGSRTMVASISGPENTGMLHWAVFRWTGGAWQFVMKRRQAAELAAAGSDIRETVSIYLDRDPRCCPSGGTKSRIWHWNGTQLIAGREQLTKRLFYFYSPSHNVSCSVGDEGLASCVSRNAPRSTTLKTDGTLTICNGRRCVAHPGLFKSGDAVLGYGERNEQGGFRCASELTGITCTVMVSSKGYGKGFLINSTGVSRVGR